MYYLFSIATISKLIKVLTGKGIDEISGNMRFNKRQKGLKRNGQFIVSISFFNNFGIKFENKIR